MKKIIFNENVFKQKFLMDKNTNLYVRGAGCTHHRSMFFATRGLARQTQILCLSVLFDGAEAATNTLVYFTLSHVSKLRIFRMSDWLYSLSLISLMSPPRVLFFMIQLGFAGYIVCRLFFLSTNPSFLFPRRFDFCSLFPLLEKSLGLG